MDRGYRLFGRGRLWLLLMGGALLVSVGLSMSVAGSASAAPRLATVELIEPAGSGKGDLGAAVAALSTFDENGGDLRQLVRGRLDGKGLIPLIFTAPSWSPDGSVIAFAGVSDGHRWIYLVNPDGSGLRRVPGTRGGVEPVIAADGRTIAFSRFRFRLPKLNRHGIHGKFYSSTTTWIVDAETGASRRLTKWRNGLENLPGSFSPDGSLLALTRRDERRDAPAILLAHTDGSGITELVADAEQPEFSPDGTKLAFIGYQDATHIEAEEEQDYDIGELYVRTMDGTELLRLTRNKQGIESSPSWDPSGRRLAYVQAKADMSFVPALALLFPDGNEIREIDADGTCRRVVRSKPRVALYGVSWQGGGEPAAAPVPC